MSYEVRVAHQAAAYFYRLLDRRTQRAILARLSQTAADPGGSWVKPITNAEGRCTALVGSWRLVFIVDDQARRVDVSLIRPWVAFLSLS